MTPEHQRLIIDRFHFAGNPSNPWEVQVREIAKEAVENPFTYVGGFHSCLVRTRGTYIDPKTNQFSKYQDIHIRLVPELQGSPELAQLIAEAQIREQTKDMLVPLGDGDID